MHEPDVGCLTNGKERKKYEFGNKVALVHTIQSRIIVALNAYSEYGHHWLGSLLALGVKKRAKSPERAYCNQDFCGKSNIAGMGNLPSERKNL